MNERVWSKFLTATDKQALGGSGWANRAGFGSRPVILVIDVNNDFTGDRDEPVVESIKRGKFMSCGEHAYKALPKIKKLLTTGRGKGLPVIYTTGMDPRPDRWDVGPWGWKNKGLAQLKSGAHVGDTSGTDIHAEIAPAAQDIIIKKPMPSAFYSTPLCAYLTLFAADSILMVGTTTSGCVRASVVDAFCQAYRVTLVEEGCFDRFESSHAMNLFDMNAKYADVVGLEEVVEYIDQLPEDLFELPRGDVGDGR